MKKLTYLITGGAGFIGFNLVQHLVNSGHNVTVVDDLSAGTDPSRIPKTIEFHQLDICNTDTLSSVCRGVDVIVHLAALPRVQFSIEHPQITHRVNVEGTLSVLEAARRSHVKRVVYAASSSVYGDQDQLPLSLDLPAQPKSPYALQKYFGEELLRLWSNIYGLETVSLRFFNVYGSGMDPGDPYALVIGKFLQQATKGEFLTITGDGEQTRDFTHVQDVIYAIMQSAVLDTVGNGEVLNVGTGIETSVNELAHYVGGSVEYIPERLEPRHTMADITETEKQLCWKPKVSVEDGIAALKIEFGL